MLFEWRARVSELADDVALKATAPRGRVGSNPTPGTRELPGLEAKR